MHGQGRAARAMPPAAAGRMRRTAAAARCMLLPRTAAAPRRCRLLLHPCVCQRFACAHVRRQCKPPPTCRCKFLGSPVQKGSQTNNAGRCQTVQLRHRASGEQPAIPEDGQGEDEREDWHGVEEFPPGDAGQGMMEAALQNCLVFKSAFSSSATIPAVMVGSMQQLSLPDIAHEPQFLH